MKNKKAPKGTTVLIGPMGVGKSLLARELSKKTGMPVLQLDLMRHCPKSIKDIERVEHDVILDIVGIREELDNAGDSLSKEARKNLLETLKTKENFVSVCERRKKLRAQYPNIPNYEDFGFKMSEEVGLINRAKEYGMDPNIIWSYYQKFYEIELLKQVPFHLTEPVILDMGGGVPVVLQKEFERCENRIKLLMLSKSQLRSVIPYSPSEMQVELNKAFDSFDKSNIVSLHLPKGYETQDRRSARDKLTAGFIASGQYDERAGVVVDTTGMVLADHNVDQEVVSNVADSIIEKTNIQSACQ